MDKIVFSEVELIILVIALIGISIRILLDAKNDCICINSPIDLNEEEEKK